MRDVKQLHPRLQEKIKLLKAKCSEAGLKIGISECLRTVEEQNDLYAQGRTKPGSKVTNAKGTTYSSMHQWGVAFDFYRNDGKGAYNTSGKFFEKVGKIGKELGLEWGGDWKSFVDRCHFQLPDWGSTSARLRGLYKTPDAFFKTWDKKDTSNSSKKTTPKEISYSVTASALRLRNKPSLVSTIITKMPRGATFKATGEKQNGFLKGMYGKKMGWAHSKYLKRR